ncbi:MAG TPA: 1-deoxy-D-xylulose-5-phosphate reductoisomerase [Cyanobacteria bacterium UBA8530]|nr:1-deoxy-D-xylulose-5-phosphate reductoisomerase [Cyanobacteria bacterium UBA8530]
MNTHPRRHLAILGSTGSIGRQTLEVVSAHPGRFAVTSLAAGKNLDLLAEQIKRFKPRRVCIAFPGDARLLREAFPDLEVLTGEEGLVSLAGDKETDTVVVAVTGILGLLPTVRALHEGKRVALANKETLVAGGSLVMPLTKNLQLLPVDSEHSALWQCLRGEENSAVEKLILTASGGALREFPLEKLSLATASEALNHPTWSMGKKVTVDSATLMNKGLEVIEAHWLFGIDYPRIEVLIHPQSYVHSLVEFKDGSTKAQLGLPDMRLPIQYALSYPERLEGEIQGLELAGKTLTFEKPDPRRYPALALAYLAGATGGTAPAVLNAANEIAVLEFLADSIPLGRIVETVSRVLDAHQAVQNPTLEEILAVDAWARKKAREVLGE